jgi:hypothetical protein
MNETLFFADHGLHFCLHSRQNCCLGDDSGCVLKTTTNNILKTCLMYCTWSSTEHTTEYVKIKQSMQLETVSSSFLFSPSLYNSSSVAINFKFIPRSKAASNSLKNDHNLLSDKSTFVDYDTAFYNKHFAAHTGLGHDELATKCLINEISYTIFFLFCAFSCPF